MKLTPTTKRIVVASIGTIGVTILIACIFNKIDEKVAMGAIGSIITGFFALINGDAD